MRCSAPLLSLLTCSFCTEAGAATHSVVTFGSDMGIVFFDSRGALAAYRMFESLNVPVRNRVTTEVKIFAPEDGSFRIACQARSADYACAVVVYPGAHARLDFDTDRVELDLPGNLAKAFDGVFAATDGRFDFTTEDKRLSISWSPAGLHIISLGHEPPDGSKVPAVPAQP